MFVYFYWQQGVDAAVAGDEKTLGLWLDIYARYSLNVKVNTYLFIYLLPIVIVMDCIVFVWVYFYLCDPDNSWTAALSCIKFSTNKHLPWHPLETQRISRS